MSSAGLDWYVIQAHPRKEPLVSSRVRELGREVFLPTVSARRPGTRRSSIGPLFPGYLFARLARDEGDLATVRFTHGVRRLLGDGEGPQPVAERLIETIRARSDRTGRVRLGAGLKRGDRVRVLDGPLTGLVGVLERPAASPVERVCVLLDVFRRLTQVELPVNAICGVHG